MERCSSCREQARDARISENINRNDRRAERSSRWPPRTRTVF